MQCVASYIVLGILLQRVCVSFLSLFLYTCLSTQYVHVRYEGFCCVLKRHILCICICHLNRHSIYGWTTQIMYSIRICFISHGLCGYSFGHLFAYAAAVLSGYFVFGTSVKLVLKAAVHSNIYCWCEMSFMFVHFMFRALIECPFCLAFKHVVAAAVTVLHSLVFGCLSNYKCKQSGR